VISPKKRVDLDMDKLGTVINDQGLQIKTSGPLGITFKKSEQLTACILKSGIMIAQTPPQLESNFKTEVMETWKSILIEGLEFPANIMPDAD
jgi:hypothetical protein